MLRQTSNASINLNVDRAMHPLTALISDLKVIPFTAKLALHGDRPFCNGVRSGDLFIMFILFINNNNNVNNLTPGMYALS